MMLVPRQNIASSLCVLTSFLAISVASQQLLLDIGLAETWTRKAISNEVRNLARDLLTNYTIPGLSLSVVHSHGIVETAAFGIRTEDGDVMTPDVNMYSAL